MRGEKSRFHSRLSLKSANYGGHPEGIHIPRAPGRTFRATPQDGFQPTTIPLLAKLRRVLFPFIALFAWLL